MTHKERSYLLPGLSAQDRKLLAGVPRKASLEEEIAFLRMRLCRLIESNPNASDAIVVRMLELLTKMVNVQAKLSEQEGDDLAELNELVRRRLIAAGLAEEPADAALPTGSG